MRGMIQSKPHRVLFLFLGLAVLSCSKPVEGCLDIRATNYNVSADEACCCTYPVLKLLISHAADTLFQSPDSIYANQAGQVYRLTGARFFLSDFVFYVRDVGPVEVSDSLLLLLDDGSTLRVKDDVIQIQRSLSTYTVGTLVTSGWIDSISFQIGLLPELAAVLPADVPADHPLRTPLNGLYTEGDGFQSLTTDLISLSTGPDTLQWSTQLTRRITLESAVFAQIGYNINVPITVDYLYWIDEEDLSMPQVMDVAAWLERIALSFRYGNL